jgi:Tfp pilus assembly protein FimT
MVVICTVLAMAAPSLRGFFASRRGADAAATLVALTQYARSEAVSEGRPYRLNVDTNAGTYWLTAQNGGTYETLHTEFGRTFQFPAGGQEELTVDGADQGRDYVAFFPDGRTEQATITLTGLQGEHVVVKCLSPMESFRVVTSGQGAS